MIKSGSCFSNYSFELKLCLVFSKPTRCLESLNLVLSELARISRFRTEIVLCGHYIFFAQIAFKKVKLLCEKHIKPKAEHEL